MKSDVRGEKLFDWVTHYATLGNHRTGTATDTATVGWLSDLLADIGLDVAVEPVEFDRWEGQAEVVVDGSVVASLAVPYEWSGHLEARDVPVSLIDPLMGGFPAALDEPIAAARASGAEVAVLATEHPQGSLVAVNRRPDTPASGFPTVLVAGRDFERLQNGLVTVTMSGAVEAGETANVIARSRAPGAPVVLTTPLTGWFSCAGERGTGIAVLVDLATRFADRPIVVLATTGHELGYFGAHQWVDAQEKGDVLPAAIVHIGASIAVDGPADPDERRLIDTRIGMTSLAEADAREVGEAFERMGLPLQTAVEQWVGEGEAFSRLGVPLLSTTGAGVDFHTPEDTAERATTPGALAMVAEAMAEATIALGATVGWE